MSAKRLLIIDDDAAIRKLYKRIAAEEGYECRELPDASTLHAALSEWQPTQILLDLQMPGADGVEALRSLAGAHCRAQIIIASGFDPRVVETAEKLGKEQGLDIRGTIQKPSEARELRAMLRGLKGAELDGDRLREALRKGRLHLAYQPKIETATQRLLGFEGLLRWHDPDLGPVPPSRFIPLAERDGLMAELTRFVIAEGVRELGAWGRTGFHPGLSLNVSATDLSDIGVTDEIAACCADCGISPSRLTLEVTESAVMADQLAASDVLARLRLKGFKLAIDDFGTGYSSLLQLRRLPFTELKIDQRFVSDCNTSQDSFLIAKTVIALAHSLGLTVVAEGVESREVFEILRDLQCDGAQGYLFGRPMAAGDLAGWLGQQLEMNGSGGSGDGRTYIVTAPGAVSVDGSDSEGRAMRSELHEVVEQVLTRKINPLWELGVKTLVGWRPHPAGIEVLMVGYTHILDHFADCRRLMVGRRLMGQQTFAEACETLGAEPLHITLPFRIGDDSAGRVPTEVVESILRRYGISETAYRGVALFDIVGFGKLDPVNQISQLNSLECAINHAVVVLDGQGVQLDMARTTTGDGFYVWNREKGPDADMATYMLMLLTLAENAVARLTAGPERVPELRACFGVGQHYSYYQVEGLRPDRHDYIVGDITIRLARMIEKCLPGQVLIGDYERPRDNLGDPATPQDITRTAADVFDSLGPVQLYGREVRRIRCYLTGPSAEHDDYAVSRFAITDKHGHQYEVFNQKFNLYLAPGGPVARPGPDEPLYLGRQARSLGEFKASQVAVLPGIPRRCAGGQGAKVLH